MMSDINWNAPYLDRRTWILNELGSLNISAEEALALLLIDFLNEQGQLITHEILGAKLHCDSEQIDELFSSLSAKGYLKIDLKDGHLIFDLSGVYTSAQTIEQSVWLDVYDQQLILYALYEASVYEKRSLDYIERILADWKRRNLTAEEYEEGKR